MYAITVVNLWPDGSSHNPTDPAERPRIEIHEPAQPATGPRAAVIICPGGGYTHRAEHEGAPFARLFAEHGIVGIVCHYRAYPHLFPAPIADAARAVRLTRHLADRFGIDPDRVGLMGFSGGATWPARRALSPISTGTHRTTWPISAAPGPIGSSSRTP